MEEWAVCVIQGMYKCQHMVPVNGQYSEEFGARVGVHQGSVLSPLHFILVLEASSVLVCHESFCMPTTLL